MNNDLDRRVMPLIYTLSAVIPLAVAVLMFLPDSVKVALGLQDNVGVSSLPLFHALLNGATFFFLVLAGVFIKLKKISIHRTFMLIAFAMSSVFLISYVVYHTTTPSAHYGGEGAIRTIYFLILISHIILSVPVIPLALFSIYRGWTNNLVKHRKIVRWAYPIWLYVSLTGVLVYVFMSPYY